MTFGEALRASVPRLEAAGVDGAGRDARILLAFVTGFALDRLTLRLADAMSSTDSERFEVAIQARVQRQPVSQITGKRLFWKHEFQVTADVLDPRPDTELLVASALERPIRRMLDLGTGSGCILLSCLAEMPMASGVGTDISGAALTVARRNAAALDLCNRAQFLQADWCRGIEGRFDLIVSNPPYIAADEMPNLAPEVRDHEPHLALTPGGDGLAAYRAIAAQVSALLLPGGRLMVEIGPTQAAAVTGLFAAQGLGDIAVRRDLDGRDRVVMAIRPM